MIPTDFLLWAWPVVALVFLLSPACTLPGWSWDRVPDADVDHYEIQASVQVCNHSLCPSLDEAGRPIMIPCCDYPLRGPWVAVRSELQTAEPTICASDADLPLPTCLDCVTFLRVGGLMSLDCGSP
jgi:hypothetical protein